MNSHSKIPGIGNLLEKSWRQSRVVDIDGMKIVLKTYGEEAGIVKWLLVSTANTFINLYPFSVNPSIRLRREVSFMRAQNISVPRPEIYLINYVKPSLYREYVEGEIVDPSSSQDMENVAATLCSIHQSGYVLGDSKISNFIKSHENAIYVIDAEQSTTTKSEIHRAWDLFVFLATSSLKVYGKAVKNNYLYENVFSAFISSYSECLKSTRPLEELLKPYFTALFSTLIPPPLNLLLYRVIKSVKKCE